MPKTNDQLRKIVNMLSDERQAPAALNILRAEAEDRRVLVSDLMTALTEPVSIPVPAAPYEPQLPDSIDIAIGKKIDHARYGLQTEIRRQTERAWLVRSPVGGPDVWLPKSQVEHRGEDCVGRAILILTIWIAREKGFL
jgi:hypothetical protein